jgi:hypothetical protein
MTKTKIALVVGLAMFAAPAAMARTHSAHPHHYYTQTARTPGYASTVPSARATWGSECVTDDGQGRFFPCDGAF